MSVRWAPPLTPDEMFCWIATCWCRRTPDRCAECSRYQKILEAAAGA